MAGETAERERLAGRLPVEELVHGLDFSGEPRLVDGIAGIGLHQLASGVDEPYFRAMVERPRAAGQRSSSVALSQRSQLPLWPGDERPTLLVYGVLRRKRGQLRRRVALGIDRNGNEMHPLANGLGKGRCDATQRLRLQRADARAVREDEVEHDRLAAQRLHGKGLALLVDETV